MPNWKKIYSNWIGIAHIYFSFNYICFCFSFYYSESFNSIDIFLMWYGFSNIIDCNSDFERNNPYRYLSLSTSYTFRKKILVFKLTWNSSYTFCFFDCLAKCVPKKGMRIGMEYIIYMCELYIRGICPIKLGPRETKKFARGYQKEKRRSL